MHLKVRGGSGLSEGGGGGGPWLSTEDDMFRSPLNVV